MRAQTGLGFHENSRLLSKKCPLYQGAFFAKNKIIILGNWAYFLFGLLQVSLFLNLYQGLLLSALLKTPNLDPFHSSDEMFNLIASGRYTYVIDAVNYYSDW